MDDSASMLCARVIRGISSIENTDTCRSASWRTSAWSVRGSRKAITDWPGLSAARSASVDGAPAGPSFTRSSISARALTSARDATMVAPFSVYAASVNPADAPAFDSTSTWCPALTSGATLAGARATRRSPGHDSRTTPMIMITSRQNMRAALPVARAESHREPYRRVRSSQFYQISLTRCAELRQSTGTAFPRGRRANEARVRVLAASGALKQRQRKPRRTVHPLLLQRQSGECTELLEPVRFELVRALGPDRFAVIEDDVAPGTRDLDHLPACADQMHLDT